jgi:hypothetical protein
MDGTGLDITGLTVSAIVVETGTTPLPAAVIVTGWLVTRAALLAAWNEIDPEFPRPGCVMEVETPTGTPLTASVIGSG